MYMICRHGWRSGDQRYDIHVSDSISAWNNLVCCFQPKFHIVHVWSKSICFINRETTTQEKNSVGTTLEDHQLQLHFSKTHPMGQTLHVCIRVLLLQTHNHKQQFPCISQQRASVFTSMASVCVTTLPPIFSRHIDCKTFAQPSTAVSGILWKQVPCFQVNIFYMIYRLACFCFDVVDRLVVNQVQDWVKCYQFFFCVLCFLSAWFYPLLCMASSIIRYLARF